MQFDNVYSRTQHLSIQAPWVSFYVCQYSAYAFIFSLPAQQVYLPCWVFPYLIYRGTLIDCGLLASGILSENITIFNLHNIIYRPLYPETVRWYMQLFEERLRGGKVVDNLQIKDFEWIIKHSTLNQWLLVNLSDNLWASPLVTVGKLIFVFLAFFVCF